ncbi:MAG: hypothetical protein NZM29_05380 [Nitrospira sp.]|nr:hypothetical protein [Nitrospira sp.]
MSDNSVCEPVRPHNPWHWLPPDRPFRREGRAWRYEFPYQPPTTIPDFQPRYSIPLPEIGLSLEDHGWLVDQPYRS